MRRNDQELPYLDQKMMNLIFENVYGINLELKLDQDIVDFLKLLQSMQDYNYRHRNGMLREFFPVLSEVIEVERNSEGASLWIALSLAIKELYGMRDKTLQRLLALVTVGK